MTTFVRFRAPGGQYALSVEHVNEVRGATEMAALPVPRPGVVGLLAVDGEALPVLSLLGSDGEHVLVVEDDAEVFGLLVEEVLGVTELSDSALGPAPSGQDLAVVAGVLSDDLGLVMVLDIGVLTGRLTGR